MTFAEAFPFPLGVSGTIPLAVAIGFLGVGLGVVVAVGEARSVQTRTQAVTLALSGLAAAGYACAIVLRTDAWYFNALVYIPVLDTAAIVASITWVVVITRVAQPTPRAARAIHALAGLAVACAVIYFAMGVRAPLERFDGFIACLGYREGCGGPVFWRYASLVSLLGALVAAAMFILSTQKIDPAERARILSWGISSPFFYAVYFLPIGYNLYSFLAAFLVVTAGSVRYANLRGERGVLMSRFLSPAVARLVREKGLDYAVKPQLLELTVVNCDLRGFTKFSQLVASDQVVRLLTEYYDAVGRAVAEFGATIKDYAGDGMLILVGAPIPAQDHAQKGLALAQRIRDVGTEFVKHWAGPESKLGIGIGVASGKVTVGAVGSESRMEYTAVGPAVNLAARLCGQAGDGEILVDARTHELAGPELLTERGVISAKGLGEVPHYAVGATD